MDILAKRTRLNIYKSQKTDSEENSNRISILVGICVGAYFLPLIGDCMSFWIKWNSQIIFFLKNKFNFHYPALVVVLSHSSLHPVVFFYSLHAMQYPNKMQRPAIQWIGFRSKSQKIYISSNLHIVHYCCLRACLCNVKCMCIGAVNAIELAWTENRMHQFMFWQS